ncbi:DUF1097 domain-containing protein, partial [Escherichia coli]
ASATSICSPWSSRPPCWRFWLLSFIPGGFLGMTLFFASGMNWTVTLLGFLAGNCVGIISEYGGQKLSEATTKRDGY